MPFVENVRAAFSNADGEKTRDSGQLLVSNLIIISGFAIIALLAANWIDTAVINKVSDVGSCVENANPFSSATVTASGSFCSSNRADTKSFKTGSDYIGRMP